MTHAAAARDATPPGVVFLEALWGRQPAGFVQIWELRDRTSTYLRDPAAAVNFHGRPDVYCAVGMTARRHGAKQRAKAHQIAAIAGLWLDIDVGPDAIPMRDDAFALSTAHLRPSIVVSSGTGLHAWYLFEGGPWIFRSRENDKGRAEREEATSLSERFYTLHAQTAAELGQRLDRSTRDLTRVLRLPGTFNAKDPEAPRPVVWLGLGCEVGPRYTLDEFRDLLRDVPLMDTPSRGRGGARAGVTLTGDTGDFEGKLDALLANSPEFADVWEHRREYPDGLNASDLALCRLAARAMTDPELALLIARHRDHHGDADDERKGRPAGYSRAKAHRTKYVADTIALAREGAQRRQRTALDQIGRAA